MVGTLLAVTLLATVETNDHGQRQISALFADRPAMAVDLSNDHRLLRWVASQFEGETAGAPIFWDSANPSAGVDAEHTPPQRGARASVRVRAVYAAGPLKGEPKPFADLWADLIFEFHNLANARRYAKIHGDVSAGDIGPSEWISALAGGEHDALLATAAFYRQRWLPWMTDHPAAGNTRRWLQIFATEPDFGRWMTRYQRPDGYPYVPLGSYFERVLEPHRFRYQVEYDADPAALPGIHWQPRP